MYVYIELSIAVHFSSLLRGLIWGVFFTSFKRHKDFFFTHGWIFRSGGVSGGG